MRIELNTPHNKLSDLFQNFGKQIDFSISDHQEDKQIILSEKLGSGTIWYREIINGMGLVIVKDLKLKQNLEIIYNHDKSIPAYALLLLKNFGGSVNLFSDKENKTYSYNKGGYLISSAIKETHIFNANQQNDFVSIFLFPEFIDKHIKTLIRPSNYNSKDIETEEFLLHIESLTAKILMGMNALEHNEFSGDLRNVYLESKVLELIALFFKETKNSKATKEILSKKEHIKILEAQKILNDNLESPPSIINLSRKVGVNEYKLRLGFKELFNNTIYGYLRQERMIKAKELIETQKMTVSEAGYMVGYSNISHFSKAFKNEYGILPSQLKN